MGTLEVRIASSVLAGQRGHGRRSCAATMDAAQGARRSSRPTVERPQALQGLQFGDPGNGSVVVWSRSDRPARMLVEWSYDEQFQEVRRLVGPHALETTDFTARQDLEGLEPGSEVFVRVSFQSLDNARAIGEPVTGRFVVPPDESDATKAAGGSCAHAICAFSGAGTRQVRAGGSTPASAG